MVFFLDNVHPEDVLLRIFSRKIFKFNSPFMSSLDKCPIYLKRPWIGKSVQSLVNQIKSYISECYVTTNMRVVFFTVCVRQKEEFLPFGKGRFALFQIGRLFIILNVDVDRTNLDLIKRIHQYASVYIRQWGRNLTF